MGRSIRTAAALLAAGLVSTAGVAAAGAVAGAQAAPGCRPSDLACRLIQGLEDVLAPVVAPPTTAPPAPSPSGTTAPSLVDPIGPGTVEASAAQATAADLRAPAPAPQVPSVPVGQALELPPITVPDFGAPVDPGAERSPLARPLRSQVGDGLLWLPPPNPGPEGSDAPWAAAVAVGVPAALVGGSVLARRLSRRGGVPDLPAAP